MLSLTFCVCVCVLLEVTDKSVPTVVTIVTLLLPLTDLLVDNDGEVGGVVAPVPGPVHLPPDHLELDLHVRLRLPSCSQGTPYLQWLLLPEDIILGILLVGTICLMLLLFVTQSHITV